MRRLHLFEFNDSPWFPELLRNYETDYLEALFRRTGLYRPVVPILLGLLKRHGQTRLSDFCSGGGGPLPALLAPLREGHPTVEIQLTDKYPNLMAFEEVSRRNGDAVSFRGESVDALAPPADLEGVRTMFDAIHHFEPEQARDILMAMERDRRPVAIFDVTNRSWRFILGSILIPLLVLVLTPTIRPFQFRRLLFTYLLPILPFAIAWDGFVSHLRAHRPEEVEAWLQGTSDGSYEWQVQELHNGPARILAVIGEPS